jgi:hypothetical protein
VATLSIAGSCHSEASAHLSEVGARAKSYERIERQRAIRSA